MKTESFVTLEVGRKYLSREGKVVEVMLDDCTKYYPFHGDNQNLYSANGSYYGTRKPHVRNLISRIVSPSTLTIQRWGVLWRYRSTKGHMLLSPLSHGGLPYTFVTRMTARRFAKQTPTKLKVVKVRCTYEVIE